MREAARLQSFDDEFRFITSATELRETSRVGVGMDMIGEAVPPLLGLAIANHLASKLDDT
jgi:DNA (cytosine-5)-methyltransferase 1